MFARLLPIVFLILLGLVAASDVGDGFPAGHDTDSGKVEHVGHSTSPLTEDFTHEPTVVITTELPATTPMNVREMTTIGTEAPTTKAPGSNDLRQAQTTTPSVILPTTDSSTINPTHDELRTTPSPTSSSSPSTTATTTQLPKIEDRQAITTHSPVSSTTTTPSSSPSTTTLLTEELAGTIPEEEVVATTTVTATTTPKPLESHSDVKAIAPPTSGEGSTSSGVSTFIIIFFAVAGVAFLTIGFLVVKHYYSFNLWRSSPIDDYLP